MKFLSLSLLALFSAQAYAQVAPAFDQDFPNNTKTSVHKKGADCKEVYILNGYFSDYGNRAGNGKVMIMNIAVRNEHFNKTIELRNSQFIEYESASFTYDWFHHKLTAMFRGNQTGYDYFTLIDQEVGAYNYGVYDVKVTMGNRTYTCSDIEVSSDF